MAAPTPAAPAPQPRSLFTWSGPLGRRVFLGKGLLAALGFTLFLCCMQASLASCLPPAFGPLFFVLAGLVLLMGAATNPFVLPLLEALLVTLYMAFPYARLPHTPLFIGLPLALLFAGAVSACLLQMLLLTARRRHDAGKSVVPVLLAGLLHIISLPLLATSVDYAPWRPSLCVPALITLLQFLLLLRPTHHPGHHEL